MSESSSSGNTMRSLMRDHDWSGSPLGAPESWPQSLRNALELILDSDFAMCLTWGPALAMLYNQAYARLLGDRHPAAFGRPVQEVWPQIWPHVRPLLQSAMDEQTVYHEDQYLPVTSDGVKRPAWFTFSYSPLRGDDGRPGGVFCVCNETTASVLDRSRQALRIRFEEGLQGAAGADAIMELAAGMLAGHLNADRAGLVELEADGQTLLFHPDWTSPGTSSLRGRRVPLSDFHPALVHKLLQGRTVLTGDDHGARFSGGAYVDIGARAGITVPLVRDGRFQACFFVHSASARRWRPDEESTVRDIAQRAWDGIKRARAEQAQREHAQHYRDIADHAPVMIWTADPAGYCDYLNPAWADYTGQRGTEGLGNGWLDMIHPQDRARVGTDFLAANAARLPFRAEYRLRGRDGAYRWVIDAAAPRLDPAGVYLGQVGAVLDIDDRRAMEAALKRGNDRFHAAINAVEGVLWTNDPAGRMVGPQPGWEALTGQAREQYQGYGWARALHPEDVQASIDAWQHAVGQRRVFVHEHRLRRHDGQWRHYSVRAIPTLDAAGEIVEWVGVHTDITELRRTEQALRQLNERLERGIRQRTRERDRLWRMSQDIMAIASLKGYFLNVNPAFCAILGWSREEAMATPFMELAHPEHRADLADKLAILAEGRPLVRYEVRALHKDGGFRWLSWTIVPEGDLLYGVARDITGERRQAETLRHTEEALRQAQKMEAVGQLTGGIAHDFNNLLAGMVGHLELMKVKLARGNADLGRHVEGALSVASRAAALTHRLLAFSRRQTLSPKPVNPNRLVASMVDMIQRTTGPSVRVQALLGEHVWNIECDPNQLESALLNLALNARDAMPQGGILGIETRNMVLDEAYCARHGDVRPGEYVAIQVADTGCGMTPEVMARAFDPFFTTKPMGQGTGLGLSMVYGFAKQSGGHIVMDSRPGAGTTVRLKLPRHIGPQEEAAAPSEEATAMEAPPQARLLLVDDEAGLRGLLAEMLVMLGYQVLQAGDAEQGLAVIDSMQPLDLMITDVGLPGGMNGRQLAEAARRRRPGLKILFITGYAEDVRTRNGLLDPSMEVLTKPFGLEVFAARVGAMLEADGRANGMLPTASGP